MGVNKRGHGILFIVLCVIILTGFPLSQTAASAADTEEPFPSREIVFVLDASNSMNNLDPNTAPQAVSMMAESLTSDFEAGFVSFDTQLQAVSDLSADPSGIKRAAAATMFKGYSNAGAGLATALTLFSDAENTDRTIVLISDGEIVLAGDGATQASISQFHAAVSEAAGRQITVNTIMIGSEEGMENVLEASRLTNGQVHWAANGEQILSAAEEILFSDLGIRQSSVAAGGAQSGRLSIALPDADMSRAKLLLTSDFPLQNVTAAANAADVQVSTGERYAVVDILAPAQTAASVAFDAVNTGNIKARLIAEYQITLAAEVAYPASLVLSSSTDKQPGVDPPTIKITASGSGKGGSVWESPVFDGKDVPFTVNGSPYTARITDGSAEVVYSGEETADYRIDADFSGLEGNFMAVTPAAVSSARPVIAPPPPGIDYRPLIAILILLVIALLLIFLLEHRRAARQKAVSSTGVAQAKKKTSKPRFTGKLNIYVTHMPDDTDVPPKTFSLYRENREKMRLHYVFLMCQLSLRDVDDDKIILRPGADGALSISNNSDSTVLKNRDLMMKGRTFLVHYEEKVTITFDNGSEVVLHYKNVKPSERV